MKMTTPICILSLVLIASSVHAFDAKDDEAAIRAAAMSAHSKATDDAIFWTGAYKRPFVLPDKGETYPEDDLAPEPTSKPAPISSGSRSRHRGTLPTSSLTARWNTT